MHAYYKMVIHWTYMEKQLQVCTMINVDKVRNTAIQKRKKEEFHVLPYKI